MLQNEMSITLKKFYCVKLTTSSARMGLLRLHNLFSHRQTRHNRQVRFDVKSVPVFCFDIRKK